MQNTRLKARLMELRASAELDNLSGMELAAVKDAIRDTETKITARAKRQAYKDLGMTRVRGANGGIYYE